MTYASGVGCGSGDEPSPIRRVSCVGRDRAGTLRALTGAPTAVERSRLAGLFEAFTAYPRNTTDQAE
jgi:hypothetical protein